MGSVSILIVFVSRCLLVLLFLPFSALDKMLNFGQAVGQAAQAVRRQGVATSLILLGLCVEVLMSLAILVGRFDRLAAFIMAGYCIVTAVLWKRFWKIADFRLKGPSKGRDLFWDFLKNVALAGGFLLLAFGVDAAGVREFVAHPLSSTHPYSAPNDDSAGT